MKTQENNKNRGDYWNQYYKSKTAPIIPSQFAVFFANEINPQSTVIELGSGNGRDAFFFSKIFDHVIAVDGSKVAIDNCSDEAKQNNIFNIDLIKSFIDDHELFFKLEQILKNNSIENKPIYIFSRFFLHSINDEEENAMILLIDKLFDNYDGELYLEFRTKKDEHLSKYTGTHFRRYVEPNELVNKFKNMNYTITYQVEGLGFAKYKVDDAHAARIVLKKI
tara:strand:+ start:4943 stop:5608 length:666 start_codon:yes stop_codon:yes gene_type:complete